MMRRIGYGFLLVFSFLLFVYFLPVISLQKVLAFDPSIIPSLKTGLLSLLFFSIYFSLVSLSGSVGMKKKYGLLFFTLSSLTILLNFPNKFGALLFLGISFSSVYYYFSSKKHSKDSVQFYPGDIAKYGLTGALNIIVFFSALSVFIYALDLRVVDMVPVALIDLSTELMDTQVQSFGCSLSQTVDECAENIMIDQIEGIKAPFRAQCESMNTMSDFNTMIEMTVQEQCAMLPEPAKTECEAQVRGNIEEQLSGQSTESMYDQCVSLIDTAVENQKDALINEARAELSRLFEIEISPNQSMESIVKESVREKFVEILTPYEEYLPFVFTFFCLTIFSMMSIIPKIFTPFLSYLFAKVFISSGVFKKSKKMVEIEVVEFPEEEPTSSKKKGKKED